MSRDLSPVTVPPHSPQDDFRYWRSYLRLTLTVLAGESVVVLVYFILQSVEPHRILRVVLASITALLATGAAFVAGFIARQTWRPLFSLGATLSSGAVLTACIVLGRGLESSLTYLLVLPIASAALALSVRAVRICALVGLTELVLIALSDPRSEQSIANLTMLVASVVGMVVLASGWVSTRTRLQVEEASLFADVYRLSETDSLTGLLNHGAFFRRFGDEIDRSLRNSEPLSLLVLDVDLFKAFNDQHGHLGGDDALELIGSVMKHTSRSFDVAGRVGGDEFAVILPATTLDEAGRVAKRMSEALERPDGIDVTVSIGYAELDWQQPTLERLFRDADAALYFAKASGRDCISTPQTSTRSVGTRRNAKPVDGIWDADRELLEERLREASRETAQTLAVIDALQKTSAVGFGVVDRDYRYIRLNQMLAGVHGGTIEDQIGRTVAETVPGLWPALEPMYRALLDTGEAVLNQEVSGEVASEPGARRYYLSNFYPIREHGEVIAIGIVAIDITAQKRLEQNEIALRDSVVSALVAASELRDPYTTGHQDRVSEIAVAIATALGLEAAEIDTIGLAAKLHDIGKLAIPAELLTRPGRLNDAEMELVRGHTKAGYEVLGQVGIPEPLRVMVLQHHERLDGSGYPFGLCGNEISLGARIIAVADVFDAMASNRTYRSALSLEVIEKELSAGSGRLFDPEVVQACIGLMRAGRLSKDRDIEISLEAVPEVFPHELIGMDDDRFVS